MTPSSPNYHTNAKTFQHWTDLACIATLHSGSLVVLGLSSRQRQPRSDTYTTRLPRPPNLIPKDGIKGKRKGVHG
ncbi:hypothetical protein TNCV_3123621 [Trichonephila clavipes]|nr:hypothetical protein TNCV_3123621 [Trichonephila clavipes]